MKRKYSEFSPFKGRVVALIGETVRIRTDVRDLTFRKPEKVSAGVGDPMVAVMLEGEIVYVRNERTQQDNFILGSAFGGLKPTRRFAVGTAMILICQALAYVLLLSGQADGIILPAPLAAAFWCATILGVLWFFASCGNKARREFLEEMREA